MNFELAYSAYWSQIKQLSNAPSQRVPELTPDDVANEMLICLWRAVVSYDITRGTFGPYWWRLWRNRRRDLLGSYYAISRVRAIPVERLPDVTIDYTPIPEPPHDADPLERAIWRMLAEGYTPSEVQEHLGISRRRYYKAVGHFRTKEVWEVLTT